MLASAQLLTAQTSFVIYSKNLPVSILVQYWFNLVNLLLSWSSSAALVAVTVTVTVTVSFECIQSHHGSRKTCSSFDKQTGPDQPKSIRPYHSINGEKSKITQRDLKARLKANNVHNTTENVLFTFSTYLC